MKNFMYICQDHLDAWGIGDSGKLVKGFDSCEVCGKTTSVVIYPDENGNYPNVIMKYMNEEKDDITTQPVKLVKMYYREDLEDGEPIQFVGVHVLKFERWVREYGIPDWEYTFVEMDDKE